MGNSSSAEVQTNLIYSKNYINFIRDCVTIIQYCETSLPKADRDKVLSDLKELQTVNSKNPIVDLNLYQTLLTIRKKTLIRHFEGALLNRQCLIYTIHEYKYLLECINCKKKMVQKSDLSELISKLESISDYDGDENSELFLNELQKCLSSDKQSWTFFEDTFFRNNSQQIVRLSDYHQYLTKQSKKIAFIDFINPQPNRQDSEGIKDINPINTEFNKKVSTRASAKLNIDESKIPHLILTCEEFQIIKRIFIKNNHKISYLSQIPTGIIDIKCFLTNLSFVKELKISSLLSQKEQISLITFIQDNSHLQNIQLNLDGIIQKQLISTLNNHPNLQCIKIFVNSMEQSLKDLNRLKTIMIKAEQISNIEQIVNPENLILQFEIKNIRFNSQVLGIMNKFNHVFLTSPNSFSSLATTIFRDINRQEQFNLMKIFLNNNKITIDTILKFTQNEDLLRMNQGTLNLGQNAGYLHLFMTKLLIELQRDYMINMIQITAYKLQLAQFQSFNPTKIFLDLYINDDDFNSENLNYYQIQ